MDNTTDGKDTSTQNNENKEESSKLKEQINEDPPVIDNNSRQLNNSINKENKNQEIKEEEEKNEEEKNEEKKKEKEKDEERKEENIKNEQEQKIQQDIQTEKENNNKNEEEKNTEEHKEEEEKKNKEEHKEEEEKKDKEEQKKEEEEKNLEEHKKEEEKKNFEEKKEEEEKKDLEENKEEEVKKGIEENKEQEEKKDIEENKEEEEKKDLEENKEEEEKKNEENKFPKKLEEAQEEDTTIEQTAFGELIDNSEDSDAQTEKDSDEENKKSESDQAATGGIRDDEENENEDEAPIVNVKREKSVYSLEGAKYPLSIYTRRVMDVSKIKNYLKSNSTAGRCGGQNLGNTCFMNSSIACLSNCTELTYYFLCGDYLGDINEENQAGMHGRLARSWGELIHEYWVKNTHVGYPSDFKNTIGSKVERFRGYGQQDSNEFMSVFLDYLNEDLNRTTKKQYIELHEKGDDETDEECAKRFWECNLKRNDSIVTDLFCGQFKSTITCPECGWINITFDPFDTINLPLLTQPKRSYQYTENIESFNFFYIPTYCLRNPYGVEIKNVNQSNTLIQCKERISKEENFIYHDKFNKELFVVDMLRKEKYGYANLDERVQKFNYSEEFIYSFDYDSKKDEIQIPIYMWKDENESSKSLYPRMVFGDKNMTVDELRKKIYIFIRKYILSPFLKEGEEKDNLSLELEKFAEDSKLELNQDKLIELIENEYKEIFKYEKEEEEEEEKSKGEKGKGKENEEEENNMQEMNRLKSSSNSSSSSSRKNSDGNNSNKANGIRTEEEEEKTEEEKKEEEKKEEDKKEEEKKEEEKKDETKKEEEQKEEEKKEEEANKDQEKTEENKNEKEEKKEEEEHKEEGKKEENKNDNINNQKLLLEKFRNDLPFIIIFKKERSYNDEEFELISSRYFQSLSPKAKDVLKINSYNEMVKDINLDLNDYLIIVKFNENSNYINKKLFDLDHFDTYSLEFIQKKEEPKEETNEEEEKDDGRMTLEKCLKKFTKEEQLGEGDEWYCSKCKKHVLAKKKMELYYLPKILIICFKRFIKDSARWEKNEDEVIFPINNMDLKNFVIGPDKDHSVYDLFAVSQHYGSTGFGHYTAVCKNNGKWYSYNDSSCHETNEEDAISSAAYVVFYRRQTD